MEEASETCSNEKIALLVAFFMFASIPLLWVSQKVLDAIDHWLTRTITV